MWRLAGVATAAAIGGMAWAVRGKSSAVFGPSVWHGPRDRKAIALTFDDGPSPSTPKLVEILAKRNVHATFFQCGSHVRRHPSIVHELVSAGHELGNHTDTHPMLAMKPAAFIFDEVKRAQEAISEATGKSPALFRPTYGVRWFGLREAQQQLGLLSVMWSCIGQDWRLPASGVASRLLAGAENGAIFCLHDGRETAPDPDIRNTLDAVDTVTAKLIDEGYQFERVSDLVCHKR